MTATASIPFSTRLPPPRYGESMLLQDRMVARMLASRRNRMQASEHRRNVLLDLGVRYAVSGDNRGGDVWP